MSTVLHRCIITDVHMDVLAGIIDISVHVNVLINDTVMY